MAYTRMHITNAHVCLYLTVQNILNPWGAFNGSENPGTINSPFLTRGINNDIYPSINSKNDLAIIHIEKET